MRGPAKDCRSRWCRGQRRKVLEAAVEQLESDSSRYEIFEAFEEAYLIFSLECNIKVKILIFGNLYNIYEFLGSQFFSSHTVHLGSFFKNG